MMDIDLEEKIFRKRLETDFYYLERAKNNGDDYVASGKLERDTEAVVSFANSDAFDVIKKLR